MKRLLASLLLCLTLGSTAMAKISFRLEGSAIMDKSKNALKNNLGDQLGLGSSTGFRLGTALEFKFLGIFYIAPGLTYNIQSESLGLAGDATATNGLALPAGSKIEYTLHHLTLPVNFGIRIKPLGIIGASIEAGPYASYQLSNTATGLNSDAAKNIFNELTKSFDGKKLSYGLNASATVELAALYVRAGVLYPLSDKFDLKEIGSAFEKIYDNVSTDGLNSKNLTYFIGLGLRF